MHSVFPMLGISSVLNSWLILSLACSDGSVKANEINVLNLCTQRYCDDCTSDEFSKCSNVAVSNLCGDLCGCCHSCVRFREIGESCGAQLAVRSSENFQDSTSRVTILATTRCKKNLICKNFNCESKLHERPIVENNIEESLDLRTNLITSEDPREFYPPRFDAESQDVETNVNENDFLTSKIELSTSTANPWLLLSTMETLSSIESHKNEIFSSQEQQDVGKSRNILIDPSGNLINLLVAGREFQLIHGHQALEDFDLLIESIDKNQLNSTINEHEAAILYQRLKVIQHFVSSNGNSSNSDKDTDSSSESLQIVKQWENKNQWFTEEIRDSRVMAILRNFVLRPRNLKISKSRSSLRKFRKKRELADSEKPKNFEVEVRSKEVQNDKNIKEDGGIFVHDIANKTQIQLEDFGRWLTARKIELNPEEMPESDKTSENDDIETEINIHITGVPSMRDFQPEANGTREKSVEDAKIDEKPDKSYGNYDNVEIFVSDANTDVTKILKNDDTNLANFSTFEISEKQKINENDSIDNVNEDDWTNFDDKRQFYDNNYEYTFTENPITLENNYYRDVDVIINESMKTIRAQLDRIETRSIVIENAIFDMMEKIDIDDSSKNIDNKETNIRNFQFIEPEETNKFAVNDGKKKIIRIFNDDSTYSSSSPENKNFTIENTRSRQFKPNRLNRRWRTVTIQPNLSEVPRISRIGRHRPNRSEENKIIKAQVIANRNKVTRFQADTADRRRQISLPERSRSMKFSKDLPKVLGQRKFPIFLSSIESNEANLFNNHRDDPRLFSSEQTNRVFTAETSQQPSHWPLNLILKRSQTADRSDRKTEEQIRIRGRNFESKNPLIEESIILLETQIPRTIRSGDSLISGDQTGQNSVRFVTRYDDDDDWNSRNDESSVNLFVVDGENSELEMTSSSRFRIPESLVLPMENFNMKAKFNENLEVDDSYSIFPGYLDYAEASKRKDEEIAASTGTEMAESLEINRDKDRSNNSRTNRKKRDVVDDFSQTQKFEDNVTNESLHSSKMLYSNVHDSSSSGKKMSEKAESSTISNVPHDLKKWLTSQNASMKNPSNKRTSRSVQMVDWLRAAQEYHEGLRQVRNAAMKTWLASREELADANLTNVKLFTREVPSYLERYKPVSFDEDFDSSVDEKSQDYPAEIGDSEDSMVDDTSEILMDILAEDSSTREKEYEDGTNEKTDVEFSQVSSSSLPRKFTIITNGNSTIRIEQMSNHDNDDTWLEDHLAEGSTETEVSYEIPIAISDNDYFDHMYESFEADDVDFDYEDPNLMMSADWLDQIDTIDSTSVEIPEKYEELRESSIVEEQEDPSSRFKRDSPLFLFKVKGNPNHDVLVWPSNWRYLIDRHLRLNRSRDAPSRTTNRRSYSRIGKNDPEDSRSSASWRTSVDENARYQEDEIPSSSNIVIREEKIPAKDSSIDLDSERKLQKSFDHRSRQFRRKNGSYRSSIENLSA